jgi:hypothetical protein
MLSIFWNARLSINASTTKDYQSASSIIFPGSTPPIRGRRSSKSALVIAMRPSDLGAAAGAVIGIVIGKSRTAARVAGRDRRGESEETMDGRDRQLWILVKRRGEDRGELRDLRPLGFEQADGILGELSPAGRRKQVSAFCTPYFAFRNGVRHDAPPFI